MHEQMSTGRHTMIERKHGNSESDTHGARLIHSVVFLSFTALAYQLLDISF